MATTKPRFMVSVDKDLFIAVEAFRFDHHYQNRADAINVLLRIGRETCSENPQRLTPYLPKTLQD